MKFNRRGPAGHDPNARSIGCRVRMVREPGRVRIVESDAWLHWGESDLNIWVEHRDERVLGDGPSEVDAWRDRDARRPGAKVVTE